MTPTSSVSTTRAELLLWAGNYEDSLQTADTALADLNNEMSAHAEAHDQMNLEGSVVLFLLQEQLKSIVVQAKEGLQYRQTVDLHHQPDGRVLPAVWDKSPEVSWLVLRTRPAVFEVRCAALYDHFRWPPVHGGKVPSVVGSTHWVARLLEPALNPEHTLTYYVDLGDCFAGEMTFSSLGVGSGQFYDPNAYRANDESDSFQRRAKGISDSIHHLAGFLYQT